MSFFQHQEVLLFERWGKDHVNSVSMELKTVTRVGLAHIATGMASLVACTGLHNKLRLHAHWWGLDLCVNTFFTKACRRYGCAATTAFQ